MSQDGLRLDQNSFLADYGYTKQQLDEARISWEVLEIIYQTHIRSMPQLKAVGDYIASRLSSVSSVHSLKVRVKDPEHLLEKIIRKTLEKPGVDTTPENYRHRVTDLVGIRALHLFKDQWQPIHEFVKATWKLRETIAYVRKGDPDPIVKRFADCGCKVRYHPKGYRSVHYLIRSQPTKDAHVAELQVRTLLEEAWSEIDHIVRYPRLSDNHYLAEFLDIFNRLAGSADEMGTFVNSLSQLIKERDANLTHMESELRAKQGEIKNIILQLEISDKQRKNLERQVAEFTTLRTRAITIDAGKPLSGYLPDLTGMISGGIPTAGIASPLVGYTPLPPLVNTASFTRRCSRCGRPYQDDSITGGSGGVIGPWCPECRSQLGRP